MLNISITVYGKFNAIEATFVRKLDGSELDTKNPESVKEYVDYFLCTDSPGSYKVTDFSPFGKYAKVVYEKDKIRNDIVVTWEHFKD